MVLSSDASRNASTVTPLSGVRGGAVDNSAPRVRGSTRQGGAVGMAGNCAGSGAAEIRSHTAPRQRQRAARPPLDLKAGARIVSRVTRALPDQHGTHEHPSLTQIECSGIDQLDEVPHDTCGQSVSKLSAPTILVLNVHGFPGVPQPPGNALSQSTTFTGTPTPPAELRQAPSPSSGVQSVLAPTSVAVCTIGSGMDGSRPVTLESGPMYELAGHVWPTLSWYVGTSEPVG